MKFFSASTNIKASRETIWKLLTDAPNFPSWNPTVIRVEGKIAPGETITIYSKLNPNRAFPVKVAEFVPNERMTWVGGMPLGLFKGVRTYTLTPKADQSIDFSMREEFSGLLLPIFGSTIPDMSQSFKDFVQGLKIGAEGQRS
jgi:hypothetical protein